MDTSRHLRFVASVLAGITPPLGVFGTAGVALALLEGRGPAFPRSVLVVLASIPDGALLFGYRRSRERRPAT